MSGDFITKKVERMEVKFLDIRSPDREWLRIEVEQKEWEKLSKEEQLEIMREHANKILGENK
jgi:hypothetical protein